MSLDSDLAAWDGRSASDIQAVFDRHHESADFVALLLEKCRDPSSQKGATWLLKRWLEVGGVLKDREIDHLYGALKSLHDWEAELHVLQMLPFLSIERRHKQSVEAFLRKTLVSEHKFVRAWAYNGFYELAIRFPEYLEETRQIFDLAMRDEAPSVKARIRNLKKKGF